MRDRMLAPLIGAWAVRARGRRPGDDDDGTECDDCVRMVHFYRSAFAVTPRGKAKEVAALPKAIHAREDRAAALEKARAVVDKPEGMRLGKAAALVRAGIGETLAYMACPREHWRSPRTNDPLERVMRELRRRTRVVGCFPDGESAVMLVGARRRHLAGTRWGTRRYLDTGRLREAREAAAGVA
jgi:putative transposase